jgi:predicted nucleic acid-binding protein
MVGPNMRLLDADILAYALYDESPAHEEAWSYLENHIRMGNRLHVTLITILETYNTLYWYYGVRPGRSLLRKMMLAMETLEHIETSTGGLGMALDENIPPEDGFLLATAREHRIPIIVTNDQHIINRTQRHGLITENPITEETRKKLAQYTPQEETQE